MYKAIKKHFKHFILFIYHWLYNRNKVRFHYSSTISKKSVFEGKNLVGPHSFFYGSLGYGSYIGKWNNISAIIGRFSSFGPNVTYINGQHTYKKPYATTSPHFYSATNKFISPDRKTFATEQSFEEFRYYDKKNKIVFKIGNDCWIGGHVTIIGGVEIGDGAVVLAHAVVTKNVPPYAIVGGIPARILGYRYDDETIQFLQKIKWWNNPPEWFAKNWKLLIDIDNLKDYYISKKQ